MKMKETKKSMWKLLSIMVVMTLALVISKTTVQAAEDEIRSGDWGYTKGGAIGREDYVASITNYYGTNTEITVPKSIDNLDVLNCELEPNSRYKKITKVTISEGVISIGDGAFHNWTRLKEVILPSSLKLINTQAFGNCLSLTKVNIPNKVDAIQSYVFSGCTSLTSITIPKSVKWVSNGAFGNCSKLEKVDFPKTVVSIDGEAFYNCTKLKSIIIRNKNVDFGFFSTYFRGCKKLCIYGIKGSTAEKIAKTSNIKFVEIATTNTAEKVTNVKLSTTSYTYDGKVKNPKVIAKNAKGNTISSKYYTVKKASGRKNVGTYTYKITFKGNYKGSKNLQFTIKPKKTAISKVESGSKQLKVKVKASTKQVTGCVVQIATDSSFKKNVKSVTIKTNKTTSATFKKLAASKKYYVRVRTYTKIDNKTYYSAWTKYTKTVNTGK